MFGLKNCLTNQILKGLGKKQETIKITYEDLRQQIRELAYKKWEEAGSPWGRDREFWLEAEEELFGKEALKSGGYVLKGSQGNVMICPLNSENPIEVLV